MFDLLSQLTFEYKKKIAATTENNDKRNNKKQLIFICCCFFVDTMRINFERKKIIVLFMNFTFSCMYDSFKLLFHSFSFSLVWYIQLFEIASLKINNKNENCGRIESTLLVYFSHILLWCTVKLQVARSICIATEKKYRIVLQEFLVLDVTPSNTYAKIINQ